MIRELFGRPPGEWAWTQWTGAVGMVLLALGVLLVGWWAVGAMLPDTPARRATPHDRGSDTMSVRDPEASTGD